MMNTQKLDLDALMFSPNFDEYSKISIDPEKNSFKFPFWSTLWGILLGTVISSLFTYTLLAHRGLKCFGHHSKAVAVQPRLLSR
jgi:hypothetical protein